MAITLIINSQVLENFIRKNNSTLKRNNEVYNLEDIYVYFDESQNQYIVRQNIKILLVISTLQLNH